MNKVCLVFGFLGIFALAVCCSAADVEGSSYGAFSNALPGTATVSYSSTNGGISNNQFDWGVPAGSSFTSRMIFNGVTSIASNFEQDFVVGNLYYRNGAIAGGSGADSVDLGITMSLTMPNGLPPETFTYNLMLINTVNTSDPIASADYVYLPTTFSATTFNVGGVDYTLELRGFYDPSDNGFVNQLTEFHVLEELDANANLVARVTSNVQGVIPEATSMMLAISGLSTIGGLALRRRRR